MQIQFQSCNYLTHKISTKFISYRHGDPALRLPGLLAPNSVKRNGLVSTRILTIIKSKENAGLQISGQ